MKKYILMLFSAAALSGCDDFIDLNPISQSSSDGFYSTEYEMEQGLAAAYGALQSTEQYGGIGYPSFMEVPSDNTWNLNTTQNGGRAAAFDNFMVDASNAQLANTWVACFSGIQKANLVITRASASESIAAESKNRILGEAYFLRALTYFNMVRIWGYVPLLTEEVANVNDAFNHTQATPDEIYKQIIKDLEFGANNLPAKYTGSNVGRVTKGAAQTLLAKVYLTQNNWSQALTLLESVIASGTYELVPNFADVFAVNNKNNIESIFEVQFDNSINGEGYGGGDPLQAGSDVNNLPSDNLLRLFNENPDDRKDATIIDMGTQGMRLYKWHDTKTSYGMGFNIIVLRYADVLLMAAEAMNELGYGKADALKYLNMVRSRSHATEYTYEDLANQTAFRDAVEKERRLELAFENHRWFDLVRTGKALEVVNKNDGSSVLTVNAKAHQLLFPIPQGQIDASGNKLVQNQGY